MTITGTCVDCGGTIAIINAETAGKDGWTRYECGGCHRYLALRNPAATTLAPPLTPTEVTMHLPQGVLKA